MDDDLQKAMRRLMERSVVTESGCRVADNTTENSKYLLVNVGGTSWYAHRLSYTTHYGPIPKGMVIRHKCDNQPCFEPSHLSIGTTRDNVHDMLDRGRHRPGGARISGEMRQAIELVKSGMSLSSAAKAAGVTTSAIRRSKLYIEWTAGQKMP